MAELADRIYHGKYGAISAAIEAAWQEEIRRRIADLENSQVQGIPLEEALTKARVIVYP